MYKATMSAMGHSDDDKFSEFEETLMAVTAAAGAELSTGEAAQWLRTRGRADLANRLRAAARGRNAAAHPAQLEAIWNVAARCGDELSNGAGPVMEPREADLGGAEPCPPPPSPPLRLTPRLCTTSEFFLDERSAHELMHMSRMDKPKAQRNKRKRTSSTPIASPPLSARWT